MSFFVLPPRLVALLALVGVAAIAIVLMLASPVRRPPTLASIHAGATQIDETGAPDLSRFQARDGTWLAYRLYPAQNGARDRIAILAHGSSASSIEMNAVAKALAGAGVTAVALDIRGHGASGTRGDIAYPGRSTTISAISSPSCAEPIRPSGFPSSAIRPAPGSRCASPAARSATPSTASCCLRPTLGIRRRPTGPRRDQAYGLSPICRASSPPWRLKNSGSTGRSRCRRSPSPPRKRRRCSSPASTRSA